MEENTFEDVKTYPDLVAEEQYAALIGIDDIKDRLAREAAVMLNPNNLTEWSEKFYNSEIELVKLFRRRPPLFIFSGDVGTGKTALAETFADQVARSEDIEVTLYKLSLNARGSGVVGEMTKLISESFDHIRKQAQARAGKKTALILFIDEADALAQSREATQMHHEDKAGVNALIRGIDSIQNLAVPVLVIMCTNRQAAIDPAIRRRSAVTFEFRRPSMDQCTSLFKEYLSDTKLNDEQFAQIAVHCAPYGALDYGYTYSDITQKILPSTLLNSYPGKAIDVGTILQVIKDTQPTVPFNEPA